MLFIIRDQKSSSHVGTFTGSIKAITTTISPYVRIFTFLGFPMTFRFSTFPNKFFAAILKFIIKEYMKFILLVRVVSFSKIFFTLVLIFCYDPECFGFCFTFRLFFQIPCPIFSIFCEFLEIL